VNAIIKISGVTPGGLTRLHQFLLTEENFVPINYSTDDNQLRTRQWIQLQDVKLEERKESYLVIVIIHLLAYPVVDSRGGRPDDLAMPRHIMLDMFMAIDNNLLPTTPKPPGEDWNEEFLKKFEHLLGETLSFDILVKSTREIIMSAERRLTKARVDKLFTYRKDLLWTCPTPRDEADRQMLATLNSLS